jgi:hypothetical protein
MDIPKALEMAQCAEINVDNMAKMIPGVKEHPLYMLIKMQIYECIINLEDEES